MRNNTLSMFLQIIGYLLYGIAIGYLIYTICEFLKIEKAFYIFIFASIFIIIGRLIEKD